MNCFSFLVEVRWHHIIVAGGDIQDRDRGCFFALKDGRDVDGVSADPSVVLVVNRVVNSEDFLLRRKKIEGDPGCENWWSPCHLFSCSVRYDRCNSFFFPMGQTTGLKEYWRMSAVLRLENCVSKGKVSKRTHLHTLLKTYSSKSASPQ